MTSSIAFEMAVELSADKRTVLEHASVFDGVNRELRPIFRMTAPRAFRHRSLFEAPTGKPLFRSWLLLGGIVPVDFDHLAFESVDVESGFVESSTMLAMSEWRHERRVVSRASGGSRLIDRIRFMPRIPGTGPVLEVVVKGLFRHRHAKLMGLFGAAKGAR